MVHEFMPVRGRPKGGQRSRWAELSGEIRIGQTPPDASIVASVASPLILWILPVQQAVHNKSTMRRIALLLIVTLFATFAAAQTDDKTNYSGEWRMIKEKSDFGKFTAPDSLVRTVDQKDVTINVHTAQTGPAGKASADVIYYTDGRESVNEIRGRESKSHCFWDGNVLVIRTIAKASNNTPIETEERWELSEGGKILTMTSHMETELTQADFKLVCERVAK